TLVSGAGSSGNSSFTIDVNGNLKTASSFDYETQSSYAIRVRSTDQGNLFVEKQFTITIVDVNEAPGDLFLTAGTIAENQASGSTVGTFSTLDPDLANTFGYTLVSGAGGTDNASFTIDGNGNLKTAASFNYEAQNSFAIRVRSTDQGSLSAEK